MIIHKKKLTVLLLFAISTFIMSFRSSAKDNDAPQFKNLTVLPKDISHDDLIAVMKNYCVSLGVRCGECHPKMADSDKLDFVSDAKENKLVARKMIVMANEINKKYFGENTATVGCMTCHNGKLNPTEASKLSPATDSTKRN